MITLGVNSVLFRQFDFATAARRIAACGYDGLEIAAIQGMCEHLELPRWREQAADLRAVMAETGLRFLSMEVAGIGDEARLESAFEAGAELGIPVVNVGPGGRAGQAGDLEASIARLGALAARAARHGVTLCVKAHVGAAIFNTPTTLAAMEAIPSPGFGIDMDPSHIFRAGERPEEAIRQVLSGVRHVHIRDYRTGQPGPGPIELQACGRGDIDLQQYCAELVAGDYAGPVCLEVIGAGPQHDLTQVTTVAAESYGYLNACLRRLGVRR